VVISQKTYEQVSLEDLHGNWELVDGNLRQKPKMTTEHNGVIWWLNRQLVRQLDPVGFQLSVNLARLLTPSGSYLIPDIFVLPHASVLRVRRERPGRLEWFEDPMPLVIEVWSPSTGAYDLHEKLALYQARQDAENWIIHPYERTLRAWRREADGSYTETAHTGGIISPVALPGVSIEMADLFD
jgi:Uma2 family endonuclease